MDTPKQKHSTAERLRLLMMERGLRQIDIIRLAEPFCKAYNVKMGRSTIQQYISGKVEPGQTKVFLLAKALGVSEGWLMGFDVPRERSDAPPSPEAYNPVVHKIPILGYISAGLPLFAEEHIEDYTYTEYNGGADYFALRVSGDSMNAAKITEGSLVICRCQDVVENGEIAVVLVGGCDATVKRFRRDGDLVQLIPQSYNPVHQIQIYDLKTTPIRVLGKVVECKITF